MDLLLRRRQMMDAIPYQRVEYLESTGVQYINTNVIPNIDDYVEMRFQTKQTSASQTISWFGYMPSNTIPRFSMGLYSLGFFCGLNATIKLGPYDEDPHVAAFQSIDANKFLVRFDNTVRTVSQSHQLTPIPGATFLFSRNGGNGVGTRDGNGTRIWYFKQVDANGIARIDFVPVRIGNVGYMYDRVTKKLFGNQGTGNFILGPDI